MEATVWVTDNGDEMLRVVAGTFGNRQGLKLDAEASFVCVDSVFGLACFGGVGRSGENHMGGRKRASLREESCANPSAARIAGFRSKGAAYPPFWSVSVLSLSLLGGGFRLRWGPSHTWSQYEAGACRRTPTPFKSLYLNSYL